MIMKKQPKKHDKYNKCEVCEKMKECHYHHIYHRKYSDEGIWVCPICHKKIHDNPQWAYDNGYLIRHNNIYIPKKEKKMKKCNHSTTMFDKTLGYIRCQFCGAKVSELKFGSSKKATALKTSNKGSKIQSVKMGYEKQDPRIKQAEMLKRRLTSINIKSKKYGRDPQMIELLKKQRDEVQIEMRKLQSTFDE